MPYSFRVDLYVGSEEFLADIDNSHAADIADVVVGSLVAADNQVVADGSVDMGYRLCADIQADVDH